jgi:hypothetical protein
LSPQDKAEILIGDDAEQFFDSELGRTVLGMAEQDLLAAAHAFDGVSLTDQEKLIELKVEVRVAKRFKSYLKELMDRGREALASSQQN